MNRELSTFPQSNNNNGLSSSSSLSSLDYDDDDDYYDYDEDEDADDGKCNNDSESYSLSTPDSDSVLVVNLRPDPVRWVLSNEAYCFNVKRFSEKLVHATFIEAKRQLTHKHSVTIMDMVMPIIAKMIELAVGTVFPVEDCWFPRSPSVSSREGASLVSKSSWPRISEFNIKLGLDKVEEYVSTWVGLQDWMFCVEFLGFESEDCSNIFVYEVEWSKPTNAFPIPQATASVYFALEVYKMVPYKYDRNVEVTYIFECSNLIHVPGQIQFHEKWLESILTSKLNFFKTYTFSVSDSPCCLPPVT